MPIDYKTIIGIVGSFAIIVILFLLTSSEREAAIVDALPKINSNSISELSESMAKAEVQLKSLHDSVQQFDAKVSHQISELEYFVHQIQMRLERLDEETSSELEDLIIRFEGLENRVETQKSSGQE